MKARLLTILALSVVALTSAAMVNPAGAQAKATAKPVPSAQACVDQKDLKAKKAMGCKLNKEEKAELKKEKAAKHS